MNDSLLGTLLFGEIFPQKQKKKDHDSLLLFNNHNFV